MGWYWHNHHKKRREGLALLIEATVCREVKAADYAKAVERFSSEDYKAEFGTSRPPKLFATCLECFGDGCVRNPEWSDDDDNREPEALDCQTCLGVGMVEIIDPPPPIATADDLPF